MAPLRLRFRFFSNFQKLYFTNPWVNSLVYEGKNGRIVGFLGVVVRKMSVFGQPTRVAFGGSCVVDPEARSNLAGCACWEPDMAGDQDLTQTDSANNAFRSLLERLGFRTIVPRPTPSMLGLWNSLQLLKHLPAGCWPMP
jgi:hypothetical protein